jgi:hypothetical protein
MVLKMIHDFKRVKASIPDDSFIDVFSNEALDRDGKIAILIYDDKPWVMVFDIDQAVKLSNLLIEAVDRLSRLDDCPDDPGRDDPAS